VSWVGAVLCGTAGAGAVTAPARVTRRLGRLSGGDNVNRALGQLAGTASQRERWQIDG
jgi:hypothetical protein